LTAYEYGIVDKSIKNILTTYFEVIYVKNINTKGRIERILPSIQGSEVGIIRLRIERRFPAG